MSRSLYPWKSPLLTENLCQLKNQPRMKTLSPPKNRPLRRTFFSLLKALLPQRRTHFLLKSLSLQKTQDHCKTYLSRNQTKGNLAVFFFSFSFSFSPVAIGTVKYNIKSTVLEITLAKAAGVKGGKTTLPCIAPADIETDNGVVPLARCGTKRKLVLRPMLMFLLPDHRGQAWAWTDPGPGGGFLAGRANKRYSSHDMAAAIEKVHWGTSVMRAAAEHCIPRRTLGYQLLSCRKGHPGKCAGAYLRHPECAGQPACN